MTLVRLCAALDAVGLDPAVEDVLDVMWLARLLVPPRTAAVVTSPAEETAELIVAADDPPPASPLLPPVQPPSLPRPQDAEPPESEGYAEVTEEIEAHLPRRGRKAGAIGAVPVRVPGVRALPGSLGLARGLRDIKRTCVSTSRWELDETATVDRIAEEGMWLPVIRPSAERWLDLALIVDASESMVIWSQLITEFHGMLAHSGAFADIRVWRLGADADGNPALWASTSASRRQLKELVDPRGRRAFLVVSDCLAPAWHTGRTRPMLTELGSTGPLAVVQPLPQRLWHWTGLAVRSARLRVHRPAQPNCEVEADPDVGCPIPVLELTQDWLREWSALVAGRQAWSDLAVAEPACPATAKSSGEPAEAVGSVSEARVLVQRFKQNASAAAYDLACHLSAVPLSLPIMRLVQRARIPGSNPAHLAEVFLSGLLKRQTPAHNMVNPDDIEYDFVPEVREVLLDTVTRAYAFGVLSDVAVFLGGRISRPVNFPALLADPQGPSLDVLDRYSRPFAKVARAVVAKFGGRLPTPAPQSNGVPPDEVVSLPEPQTVRVVRKVTSNRPWRFALSSRETGGVMAPRRTLRPMIFLGLGGEGGRIGAEVERELREEFCGADGTKLLRAYPGNELLPYQLPSFFQFVYVDLDEDDIRRQRNYACVDSDRNSAAINRNVHYSSILFPRFNSYSELAKQLRVSMPKEVGGWLPPAVGEPVVAPLSRGAAGLPTVGRAALFDAMCLGVNRVVSPIVAAIGTIAKSAGQLSWLGGRFSQSCDVFVAFSSAGGTGAGMFYDYLHIVDDVLAKAQFRAQIFPLVVLPPTGSSTAVLNGGSVLADLFRLVDEQRELMNLAVLDAQPDAALSSVSHPRGTQSRLRPTSLQSAFLFGGVPNSDIADIRHNAATLPLLMSVYGAAEEEMSFADAFVRHSVSRGMPSLDGIGSRVASTLGTASMVVPIDELAALVADRLLAESLADLMAPGTEDLEGAMGKFFEDAGITELYELRTPDYSEPSTSISSASAVERAFRDTAATMSEALKSLREELAASIPDIAARFDPDQAIWAAIGMGDLFQAWRTYSGVQGSNHEEVRLGFARLVRARRGEGIRPDGIQLDSPATPTFRAVGVFRRSVPKSQVRAATSELVRWYKWRSAREWQLAWGSETQQWTRKLDAAGARLQAMVSAFTEHAHLAEERFDRRCGELRDQHGVVSYLLPENGDLDVFYASALARLRQLSGTGGAGEIVTTAEIVRDLLGPDIWTTSYEQGLRHGPRAALSIVLERLRNRVQGSFHWTMPGQSPLLPKLSDTLTQPSVELAKFCASLPNLIPADLVDDSHTSVRIQLFYPSTERNSRLEKFILENAALNRLTGSTLEMYPVPTEKLTAVVFSTGIGLTQVPDARAALRASRAAIAAERPDDLMQWRHRLGQHNSQIAADSRSAIILRGMLIAMWNGQVGVTGPPGDPDTVTFQLNQRASITLDLGSHRVDRFSSWGWLLRAYEDWALEVTSAESWTASEILLRSLPVHSRMPNDATVLTRILALRHGQASLATQVADNGGRHHWAGPLARFWTRTFSAALDAQFSLHRNADNTSLRNLIA